MREKEHNRYVDQLKAMGLVKEADRVMDYALGYVDRGWFTSALKIVLLLINL